MKSPFFKTPADLLESIIKEELRLIISEQEEPAAAAPELDLDLGGGDLDAGGTEDLAGEDGGLDGVDGDLDGADGDGLDGDGLDIDGEDGEGLDGEDDFGGGFGGGGFGGSGGGGGGLGGDDSEAGGDAEDGDETEALEDEGVIPTDRAQGVVDDVKAALEAGTVAPQDLLNIAKGSTQKYFEDFEEAYDVITKLEMEEDPLLKQVGDRLGLFLRGY